MTHHHRKIPNIVGKLRYMCKQYPADKDRLLRAANDLLKTIEMLNTPSDYYERLNAYRMARLLIKSISNEDWPGERKSK